MYPTIYRITYFDEVDKEMKSKDGLIFSHSYTDAMEEISTYYGDDNIDDIFIRLLPEGHITLTQKTFNKLLDKDSDIVEI